MCVCAALLAERMHVWLRGQAASIVKTHAALLMTTDDVSVCALCLCACGRGALGASSSIAPSCVHEASCVCCVPLCVAVCVWCTRCAPIRHTCCVWHVCVVRVWHGSLTRLLRALACCLPTHLSSVCVGAVCGGGGCGLGVGGCVPTHLPGVGCVCCAPDHSSCVFARMMRVCQRGRMPLHVAVHHSSAALVAALLDACPAAADMGDGHGCTALHLAASAPGCPTTALEALIARAPASLRRRDEVRAWLRRAFSRCCLPFLSLPSLAWPMRWELHECLTMSGIGLCIVCVCVCVCVCVWWLLSVRRNVSATPPPSVLLSPLLPGLATARAPSLRPRRRRSVSSSAGPGVPKCRLPAGRGLEWVGGAACGLQRCGAPGGAGGIAAGPGRGGRQHH